jgi:putative heme iron utilization protein
MNQNKKAKEARKLLLSEYQAILSTHSVDVEGYPFGSVVPYCLSKDGMPIILISTIAQHTKNILSDSRVSIIATESGADDNQTVGRITYIGNAEKLGSSDTESQARYYQYFPQSIDYHKTHNFDFYQIQPVRIRFIGGFGEIYWLEKESFLLTNPFSFDEEKSMIDHMNADHIDAMKHYCHSNGINYSEDNLPVMVSIDSEGFNLRVAARIHRVNFVEPVTTAMEVRQAMVAMAKKPV